MRTRSGKVQARHLSPGVKLAYSALLIPTSMLHAPALSIIPALYAKYSAVSFTAIGLILILTRSLDAITDPLVGYCSDRIETGMGLRKPWIIASVPLVMIAVYNLFLPPEDVDQLFLLIWIMVLWFGWTLFNIPYFAWGAELTPDYVERTRVTGWRTMAGLLGTLLAQQSSGAKTIDSP